MWENHNNLSRRELLRLAIFGAVGTLIAACQGAARPIAGAPSPEPTKDIFAQGAPPPAAAGGGIPVTANKDFYTVAYRDDEPPRIPADWKLKITGQVDKEVSISLDELKALPAVTQMRTLECISNPVGGDLISNAVWKGVRLKDLLAQAGLKPGARFLKLESFDGYSTGIPVELGTDDDALLVYDMNGEPLPAIHGAPLRCLWPGRYGMKQPKWIQTITAVTTEYHGYWENQGWSNEATIQPNSRIDSPQDLTTISTPTFTLSGIAFTNKTGLAKLEISWDDAQEWRPAELERGPSPYVWTPWKWTGPALPAGRHTLYARATDNNGNTQARGQVINLLGGTFPSGTSDMHSIVLEFKA
jgi:DMSO/TMAO reductase YedYZ molybdopterin-dependent catalytic subunit